MKPINSEPTLFTIVGIGAIGGLISGQFFRNNCPITLLLKNDIQLNDYKRSGLTLIHPQEKFTCYPNAININNVQDRIKHLIVCVKAHEIMNVLNILKQNLTEQSLIILIHNGLGILDEIKKTFPHLRIIIGISNLAAYYESPFIVRCFMKDKLYLGTSQGSFTENEIKEIKNTFKRAKIHFSWTNNIKFAAWKKFSINCTINILSALYYCKYGELLKHKIMLENLTREIASVLRAYGIKLSPKNLFKAVVSLLIINSESYSSMLQDVKRGRQTELPYLNLYLIKLAKQKNISVPLNLKLIKEFNELTSQERQQ